MADILAQISAWLPLLSGFLSAVLVVFTVFAVRSTSKLRYSHSIAVLGYPRSGKTTLIVTLLQHILSGVFAKQLRITGNETIDRVIRYNEQIKSGENLKPTKDEDSFIYRFQIDVPESSLIIRLLGRGTRAYDVALADFPGEYSKRAVESKPNSRPRKSASAKAEPGQGSSIGRLYGPEYHSWISQADTYLILVDVAEILKNRFEITEISARIFSAVLYLKESSLEDSRSLADKPVRIIFTKSDLLLSRDITLDQIDLINFKNVQTWSYEHATLLKHTNVIKEKFASTIEMLENNFSNCDVIFHSSYMTRGEFEDALGSLVQAVIPDTKLNRKSPALGSKLMGSVPPP